MTGSDDTTATGTATITTCPAGGGGGQVLGETTTTPSTTVKQLANTGTSIVLPTILAISMTITAAGVMFGNRMQRKSATSDPTL